jgi:diguanylate cyclase (GGDEF)-like protein/PAS domain S-box-containing protein
VKNKGIGSTLDGLFGQSPQLVLAASLPDGLILYANPRALEVLEYGVADILGEPLPIIFYDASLGQETIAAVNEGCSHRMARRAWRRARGSTLDVGFTATPANLEGQRLCLVLADHDATQHCAYLTARSCPGRDPEALYRLITENMGDVVWWMDLAQRKLLYVSPSVRKLLGYGPDERGGERADAALTAESRERMDWLTVRRVEEFKRTGRLEKPYVDVLEMCHRDGHAIWVEVTSNYVFGEGGRVEVVGVTRDITERRVQELAAAQAREAARQTNLKLVQANVELERLATLDPLTGVWNRRRFLEALEAEMERFRRYVQPVSLIMFDLDHFKAVNDRFGHGAGDKVLAETARLARENVRATDSLARLGGEEFAVLSPGSDVPRALSLSEKLRRFMGAHQFPLDGFITASFGVAGLEAGMDIDQWLGRADDALYAAKRAGRNTVRAWGEEPAKGVD